jgi:hypothetical protein
MISISKTDCNIFTFSLTLVFLFCGSGTLSAQIRRGEAKIIIMDSGVAARVPCGNPTVDTTHNADGSIMYVVECQMETALYNVVVIKSPTAATGTAAEREYRLIFYANQFKTMMEIESCPIFERDKKSPVQTEAVGIYYVCTAKDGSKYAIQGWQLDNRIVLYSISGTELPSLEAMQPFFNSVYFR